MNVLNVDVKISFLMEQIMSVQIVDVLGITNKHRQMMGTIKMICNVLFSSAYLLIPFKSQIKLGNEI